MKKKSKNIIITKTILLQILYSVNSNEDNINNTATFLLHKKNKKNVNKFFLMIFIKKFNNKKQIIIKILHQNTSYNININVIEVIILNMFIFELFFNIKNNIKNIIIENIILAQKFCSKNAIYLVKNIFNIIIKLYMIKYLLK